MLSPEPSSTTVPTPGPASPGPASAARAARATDAAIAAGSVGALFLAETARGFHALQNLAEDAVAQVADADLWHVTDAEANSIGVLMRHVAGNLRSRFTGFPHADGEKPDRDRDDEFVAHPELSRQALEDEWRAGWACLHAALAALGPDDLLAPTAIRGERTTVLQALERATRHVAQHAGQIVLLARQRRGAAWRTLSIPRGASRAYDAAHRERVAREAQRGRRPGSNGAPHAGQDGSA